MSHQLNQGYRIVLASDHAGVDMKAQLLSQLQQRGHTTLDMGPATIDRVDYPDYARSACEQVLLGAANRAVLICGSGIGMSMAANRITGIRCAVVTDPYMAQLSRAHNNSNVLALGARVLGPDMAWQIVLAWLRTPFDGGRHEHRVLKLDQIT